MVAEPICEADFEIHVLADQNRKFLDFIGGEALLRNRDAVAGRRRQWARANIPASVEFMVLDTHSLRWHHHSGALGSLVTVASRITGNGAKSGGCLRAYAPATKDERA